MLAGVSDKCLSKVASFIENKKMVEKGELTHMVIDLMEYRV